MNRYRAEDGDSDGLLNRLIRALDVRSAWALGLTVVTLAVAAVTLYIEANTEPYHIDELRQVRPYGRDLQALVSASLSQEQPPLDVLIGSRFQQILGVGDVLQRSHSMVAGVLALVFLAALLWRVGIRLGVPVAIGILALTPAFVSLTAYARPYALPLALMFGYALAADFWLSSGRKVAAGALTVCAFALPLSRVFEPPAFLVLSSVAIWWFGRTRPTWGRRIWWPITSSIAALVLVELPVYVNLQSRLTAYGEDGTASLSEQWSRILEDSLPRLADVFVQGWIALAVVVVAMARPAVRRQLAGIWWFWPIIGTVLAFAFVFHIRTQPTQPFYARYGFFWLPVFAIVAALLVQSVTDEWNSRSARDWIGAASVAAFVFALVPALVDDFSSTRYGDYRSLGAEVEQTTPTDTALVFDSVGIPFGSYRPGYAGYGRYTSPSRQVIKVESLLRQPEVVVADRPYVIGTNGPVLDVDGWLPTQASETMTLYVSDGSRTGPIDMAEDLIAFGNATVVSNGAMFRLGGAALLLHAGEIDAGCEAIAAVLEEDPMLATAARYAITAAPVLDALQSCPAGNPLGDA